MSVIAWLTAGGPAPSVDTLALWIVLYLLGLGGFWTYAYLSGWGRVGRVMISIAWTVVWACVFLVSV